MAPSQHTLSADCVERGDLPHTAIVAPAGTITGSPPSGTPMPAAGFVVRDHYVARLLTLLELLSSAYRLAKP